MNVKYERICANVNLDAILANMNRMHEKLPDTTQMIAVIKTDGYGHGAAAIAHELENIDYVFGYAVATAEEAMLLRWEEIRKPIVILGYTFPDTYDDLVKYDIRPTVFKEETAKQLSECAMKAGHTIKIHIKVDTGMSRIGFSPEAESIEVIRRILNMPMLQAEGIFTHFAKADYHDKSFVTHQLNVFREFVQELEEKTGYHFPIRDCANSAAIMELKESCENWDLVRAGVSMYGLWPSEEMSRDGIFLTPALELKSHIVLIKEIEAGTQVSYGGTYTAAGKVRLATIPVGYGDGYPRLLSNNGEVLIRGKRARICGRVCMDQFMVDVTDIPEAEEYDEVTLIGRDGEECITAEELGERSGRFNYELMCDLNKRIPRVYYKNQKIVSVMDYVQENCHTFTEQTPRTGI